MSLPWSTSATGILLVLWLIALLPTLDLAAIRREVMTPAGGLPVSAMGTRGRRHAVGRRRLARARGRARARSTSCCSFRCCWRSSAARGARNWVVLGFLASSALLLVLSFALAFVPGLPWRGKVTARRAGQGLHRAERHLRVVCARAARAGDRVLAPASRAACAGTGRGRGAVRRQHPLRGDRAHDPGGGRGAVRCCWAFGGSAAKARSSSA